MVSITSLYNTVCRRLSVLFAVGRPKLRLRTAHFSLFSPVPRLTAPCRLFNRHLVTAPFSCGATAHNIPRNHCVCRNRQPSVTPSCDCRRRSRPRPPAPSPALSVLRAVGDSGAPGASFAAHRPRAPPPTPSRWGRALHGLRGTLSSSAAGHAWLRRRHRYEDGLGATRCRPPAHCFPSMGF